MTRILAQLFAWTCVATLLAQGIGLGFLWGTGRINQEKVIKILAVIQDVKLIAAGPAGQAGKQPVDSEQVSFEAIEKRRALEALYLETKTLALNKGLQEVSLQRGQLADDMNRLKRLQAGFGQQLQTLAEKATQEGIEKQRQIWTKIDPALAKNQIMDMVKADEIDDVVVLLSDMQVSNQAKIISQFDLTKEEERDAVDEILRKIRKGLPAASLIKKARQNLQR